MEPTDEYVPYNVGTILKDGSRPADLRLDRLVQFDERSRGYSAVEDVADKKRRSYTWRCDTFLDQGREGACVGFAFAHELAARPAVIPSTNAMARGIYHEAQRIDPWEGGSYEGAYPIYEGTSVLAGAKAVQKLKDSKGRQIMPEYRWAFGVSDMVLAVGYKGPAILGINWYQGMNRVDENGFIRPTGSVVGGHSIVAKAVKIVWLRDGAKKTVRDIDPELSYFVLHNSWGKEKWGVNGTARINVKDMDRLLHEQGECLIPVLRKSKK